MLPGSVSGRFELGTTAAAGATRSGQLAAKVKENQSLASVAPEVTPPLIPLDGSLMVDWKQASRTPLQFLEHQNHCDLRDEQFKPRISMSMWLQEW